MTDLPICSTATTLPPLFARPLWRAADAKVRRRMEDALMQVLRVVEAEGAVPGDDSAGAG